MTPEDLRLQSETMRGVAFYQEGLSAAQRRLLLEAAVELETTTNSSPGANATQAEAWLLHFSPEPARIRLPANLPAPLAKKISDYVSAKKGLTTELCDVLRRNNDVGTSARTEALKLCREKLSLEDRDLLDRFHQEGATAKDVAQWVGRNVHYVYRAVRRIHDLLFDCIKMAISKDRASRAPAGADHPHLRVPRAQARRAPGALCHAGRSIQGR